MNTYTVLFHADAYIADALKPDEWELKCSCDAEATREAVALVAKRLGVPAGLVRLESNTADITKVLVRPRIGAGFEYAVGEVEFIY